MAGTEERVSSAGFEMGKGERVGSPPAHTRPRGGHLLVVLAVVVVAVVGFAPAANAPLLGPDRQAILDNPGIRSLGNIPSFFTAEYWNRPEAGGRAYRPLTELTFALDHRLWGGGAWGFRLTQLFLHALVAVTVYAVVFRFVRWKLAALLAAALFAAHPVHAETVNFVKNRGDILSTLLCLLSWWAFVEMVERVHRRQLAALPAGSAARGLMVGVGFFILALFSKEVAITLPVLLLLYTAALVPVGWRGWAATQTLVWWVALWGYLALSLAAIKKFSGAITSGMLAAPPAELVGLNPGERALAVVKTIGIYLRLILFPAERTIYHRFDLPTGVGAWPVVVTLSALVLLVVLCAVLFRRHRLAAFALAWLPITLLPVSNVVLLAGKRAVAEHRLYLPTVGFALLVGAILGGLARRRLGRQPFFGGAYRVAVVLVLVVLAGYLVRSTTRSAAWSRDYKSIQSPVCATRTRPLD